MPATRVRQLRVDSTDAERRLCVIRFWNNDILANIEGVQEMILEHLRSPHPPDPHPPSPSGLGSSLSRKRERG